MLWKLHRTPGKPPRLERVDTDSLAYDPTRRRVVLFPGAGAWDRSEEATKAGSIKYIEQTVISAAAASQEPIDIYLYTYELPYEDYGAKRNHYQMKRFPPSVYGRNATQFTVLPLLLGLNEKLGDLNPETMKERLSRITLVGHSYGSVAIQDVANTLGFELGRLGWDEHTTADTLKELVGISVAPISRTDYPAPNLTQYFFTSENDMTAVDSIRSSNPQYEDYVPMLKACGYKTMAGVLAAHGENKPRNVLLEGVKAKVMRTRREGVMPRASIDKTPSGYVLSAMLPDDEIRWIEEKQDGVTLCRTLNSETAKDTQTAVVHDYRNYLHGAHTLGQVLINVVNQAVLRDVGIGDGHQLLMNSELTRAQHSRRHSDDERARAVSERGLLTLKETPPRR